MKKFLLSCLITFASLSMCVKAKSITTGQMFNNTVNKHLSFGGGKFGWIEQTGDIFTHYYMDTLLNYTAYPDSNLLMSPSQSVFDTLGYIFCASTMATNGQLIGLFFDTKLYNDSATISFPNNGGGCYFLYDYSNQQSQYFYFSNANFVEPSENLAYEFEWVGNQLHLTMVKPDFGLGSQYSWTHGFEFNGINLVSSYVLPHAGALNSTFIDHEGNLNYLGEGAPSLWYKVLPNNTTIDLSLGLLASYNDGTATDTASYVLYSNNDAGLGPFADTVIIKSASYQTKIGLPYSSYGTAALCVDHAKRIWVVEEDSILMYDGTNWNSFYLNGINTTNGNFSAAIQRSFFEYRKNCFALTFYTANSLFGNVSNGIIFINYNDGSSNNVLNHVQGSVFYDINSNLIQDIDEPSINNQIITTGAYTTNAYSNGLYNLLLPYGAHNIQTYSNLPYISIAPAAQNLNFTAPVLTDTNNINFAFQPIGPIADLKVNLSSTPHRNGRVITYVLSYSNTGTSPVSGSVALQYEPILNFDSTTVPPASTNPGALSWNFNNLLPFETRNILCYFYNVNLTLNDTISSNAGILPLAGDAVPLNNLDTINNKVVGPFDPNKKDVFQNGNAVNTIYNSDYLEYTIHFQNVGNDTAFTVSIIDTLDNHLDISTLEIIGSTHNYTLSTSNRILQFNFNNINLPDSTTNAGASIGLISYRVKPINALSNGTQINNYAAIYFDVNAPIITNNAQVIMATPTKVSNKYKAQVIRVYPNPTNDYVTLENLELNTIVNIKNVLGQTLSSINVSHAKMNIDMRDFYNGIYMLEVVQEKNVFSQKVILQQ